MVTGEVSEVTGTVKRLSALLIVSLFLFLPFISVGVFLALLWSRFWWLGILVATPYFWYVLQMTRRHSKTADLSALHGTRSRVFSELPVWRWVADLYRMRLEYTGKSPLDPSRHYLFALHPHGIFALSERLLFWATRSERWDKVFPGIDTRDLCATSLLILPGARWMTTWTACVLADRAVAKSILTHTDKSILLFPGGEKEQLATEYGKHKVWLKGRYGFCKLSLEHGAPIVPAYIFGSSDCYLTSSKLQGFRKWLQRRFAIAIPLFWGHPFFFWMPRKDRPIVAVVGAPIEVQKTEHPTKEQIEELLLKYKAALTDIFNSNKDRLGYADAVLEIDF